MEGPGRRVGVMSKATGGAQESREQSYLFHDRALYHKGDEVRQGG